METTYVFIERPYSVSSCLTKVADETAAYASRNYCNCVCDRASLDTIVTDLCDFAAKSCAAHSVATMPTICLDKCHLLDKFGVTWLLVGDYTITCRKVKDIIENFSL